MDDNNKIIELLETIQNQVKDLETVVIKNGGGRHISYRRDEFFQMLYDRARPSKVVETISKFLIPLLTLLQIFNLFIIFFNK